jgi:ABC-type antimicrobial peptide transport system permease subunit
LPILYEPLLAERMMSRGIHMVIRSHVDSVRLAGAIRRAAAAIDPDVPVYEIETQTSLIDGMLRTERLLSTLSSAFSVVALLLAAVGLGGLLAYAVARRTNEIGVRMALGAAPGDVVRMILRDSLWLVGAGIVIGLPCAAAMAHLLKTTLFGLQPADPLTGVVSLGVLGVVAALAASIPARRAAKIDPIAALRYE